MKTIMLTGATSGIGRATAGYLSENGYRLILVARDEEKLKNVINELGNHHFYYVLDLNCSENTSGVFGFLKEEGIKLDGMAYCAGIAGNMPFRNIRLEEVAEMMQVNCYGFINLAKDFIKKTYSNDGASIVAIASLSAITAYTGTCSYSISKNALISACKVLSKEVLRRNIRVNTVLPGYVDTRMMAGCDMDQVISEQPWGFVNPKDVAQLVEFLLSDKSKMITGAQIPISGGMTF